MVGRLKNPETDRLFEAILQLDSIEECYALFEDLCTIGEVKSMTQRFQIARLLAQGATYAEISARTGVSTATISRVNRCLEYGADGYRLALDRLAAAEPDTAEEKAAQPLAAE
ncbi:MAG: helix-turn-helix domain-containing protein [Clostridiaceae bacterium]|nr:helix-turn-helix domain-containing protein [Clostridiaceae bacterium]